MAAVEFALVITTMLVVTVALIGYGALFWMQQKLVKAAGEGAQAVVLAALSGTNSRPQLQSMACLAVRRETPMWSGQDAGGQERVGCVSSFEPCTWNLADATPAACVRVRVAYRTSNWPLMAMVDAAASTIASGGRAQWFASSLSADAVVQIPQVPQEPAT